MMGGLHESITRLTCRCNVPLDPLFLSTQINHSIGLVPIIVHEETVVVLLMPAESLLSVTETAKDNNITYAVVLLIPVLVMSVKETTVMSLIGPTI